MTAHEKAPPGLLTGEARSAFLDRNRFHNTGPMSAAQGDWAIGIDIGARDAVAAIPSHGELFAVHDMPVLEDGPAGRLAVSACFSAVVIFKSQATIAHVEHVSAPSGECAASSLAFHLARGFVESVLAAAGVRVAFLTAAAWKRTIRIPPGRDGAKDLARSEATRRWPLHPGLFAGVCNDCPLRPLSLGWPALGGESR
jgi:hypothetical protein